MSRFTFDPTCGLDIATTTIHTLEDIATISYWGYRVINHDGEDGLFIHEAYYDHREGLLGIAKKPATACGDSREALQETVGMIADALDEPTLEFADFALED